MNNQAKSTKKERKESFPFGLPVGCNLDELLLTVNKVTNFVDNSRKITKFSTYTTHSAEFDKYLEKISTKRNTLTQKEKGASLALCVHSIREEFLNKACKLNMLMNSVEGVMINAYLAAKKLPKMCSLSESKMVMSLPDYYDGIEIPSLITSAFKFNLIAVGYPDLDDIHRIIPMMLEDLNDPKLEKLAAHAFFAMASISDNRVMLECVRLVNEPMFKKYYSILISKGDPVEILSEGGTIEYSPQIEDESDILYMKNDLFLYKVCSSLEHSQYDMSFMDIYMDNEMAFSSKYSQARENIAKINEQLNVIDSDIENFGFIVVKDGIQQLFEKLRNSSKPQKANNEVAPQKQTKNAGEQEVKQSTNLGKYEFVMRTIKIDDFCDALEALANNVNNRNASEIDELRKAYTDINNEASQSIGDMVAKIESISNEIKELVNDDPIKNSVRVGELCVDAKVANHEIEDLHKTLTVRIEDAILALMNYDYSTDVEIIEPKIESVAPCEYVETEKVPCSLTHQINELLENERKLKSEIEQLNESIRCERDILNQSKQGDVINGMRENVRELLQKIARGPGLCTIEEMLDAITHLYPDRVVVLPSALKSAKESEFTNKKTLWEQINTLVVDYLDMNRSGKPDSESRKVFPVKQYAGNESKTTGQSKLRKERTERYLGEDVYFEKHLRFGIARNIRESLRLHFEVIGEKIVIAHCGNHKTLQK